MFLRISRILIICSISLFLISCNKKEDELVAVDTSAWNDDTEYASEHSHSGYSSDIDTHQSHSSISSPCKLDRLCNEYQKYANQLMRAVESENFQRMSSINEDLLDWAEDWEYEINRNSCTGAEMINASTRMMSIANSLLGQ